MPAQQEIARKYHCPGSNNRILLLEGSPVYGPSERDLPNVWKNTKGFFDPLFGKDVLDDYRTVLANIANSALEGKIYTDIIMRLPKGSDSISSQAQSEALAMMQVVYFEQKPIMEERKGKDLPYQLGTLNADFLELIPKELSAAIMLSSWDAKNSKNTTRNYSKITGQNVNPRLLAVESFVLMEDSRRQQVFEVMRGQDKGTSMELLGDTIANFHNTSTSWQGGSAGVHIFNNAVDYDPMERTKKVEVELATLAVWARENQV